MVLIDVYDEGKKPLIYLPNGEKIDGRIERDRAHRMGLWHRNSYVVPCTEDGRVLLQLRAKKAAYSDMWAVPAEHPNTGESNVDAAVRGLGEEQKMRVTPSELIWLLDLQVTLKETDDFTDREFQTYYGLRWQGTENVYCNSNEVKKVMWVPAYVIGQTGKTTPLGPEHLKRIKHALVDKKLLKPKHIRPGGKGSWTDLFSVF